MLKLYTLLDEVGEGGQLESLYDYNGYEGEREVSHNTCH